MKRIFLVSLILVSVIVTIYINSNQNNVDPRVKAEVERLILAIEEYPARPVWWQDDSVLAVGVVKKSDNHDSDAITVCKIAKEHGVTELLVEIYDILEIQQSDNWVRIGSANCAALVQ